MTKCMTETAPAGTPPEALAALQQAAVESCDTAKTGEDEAKFNAAVAACAGTACGMGGSEYLTCLMTKLME
jgi:hypothetical protein